MASDKTMNFKVEKDKNLKTKEILKEVYQALEEKGYKTKKVSAVDMFPRTPHIEAVALIEKI